MAKAKAKKAEIQEWMYEVVRNPIVTEKSMMGSEHGQVTFKVAMDSTKPRIKQAVEALFNVKVKSVNTLIQKGKEKRFKGQIGRRSDMKKAIICLEDGQSIDVGTGV